ncbi:MAG: formate transporter FocA [Alsobacter sp.]
MRPLRNHPARPPGPAAPVPFELLLPPAMALKAEEAGARKAAIDPLALFVLAVLAGAFIAFGAIFATTVGAGTAALPYGVARLLTGLVFSLGLILVIVGGAELFTGNTLVVMAWASRKVTTTQLLANWVVAFAGNTVGAVATAALVFLSGQYAFGNGAIGLNALGIAEAKLSLGWGQAFALGILCNTLVCLAVWMCYGARTSADRILTIVPPISAFVAAGFEHSIANLYFVPVALFIQAGAPDTFWSAIGRTSTDFPHLGWPAFLSGNLLPVTLGNVLGGSVFVAIVYWFVYLRGVRP